MNRVWIGITNGWYFGVFISINGQNPECVPCARYKFAKLIAGKEAKALKVEVSDTIALGRTPGELDAFVAEIEAMYDAHNQPLGQRALTPQDFCGAFKPIEGNA